jgi:hypothetical protein
MRLDLAAGDAYRQHAYSGLAAASNEYGCSAAKGFQMWLLGRQEGEVTR